MLAFLNLSLFAALLGLLQLLFSLRVPVRVARGHILRILLRLAPGLAIRFLLELRLQDLQLPFGSGGGIVARGSSRLLHQVIFERAQVVRPVHNIRRGSSGCFQEGFVWIDLVQGLRKSGLRPKVGFSIGHTLGLVGRKQSASRRADPRPLRGQGSVTGRLVIKLFVEQVGGMQSASIQLSRGSRRRRFLDGLVLTLLGGGLQQSFLEGFSQTHHLLDPFGQTGRHWRFVRLRQRRFCDHGRGFPVHAHVGSDLGYQLG